MKRLTTRPQAELTKCISCKSKYDCYTEVECGAVDEAIKKLKKYEDLEEQGLLLKLPSEIRDIDKKALEYSIIKAINLTRYGVDISNKFETATEMSYALNQAYIRGRQDEVDRINKLREL